MEGESTDADIAILIPLEEEFDIFKTICPVIKSEVSDAVHYHTVRLPGSDLRVVAVVIGGMGPTLAGQVTEKVLSHLHAGTVVLIGLAGSLSTSVKIADVIIANEINEFQASSKAVAKQDSFAFEYSGNHWRTDFSLLQFVRNFPFSADTNQLYDLWRKKAREFRDKIASGAPTDVLNDLPQMRIGHIASANTVIASRAYAAELHGIDRNFIAVEMEAAGVAQAAYGRSEPTRTLVIRGISDFADERKSKLDAAADGFCRKYAMFNATSFFLSLVQNNSARQLLQEKKSRAALAARVEDIISLYVASSYERDRFAKLDQAGESDPDRSTLLSRVFVDLEVKPRKIRQSISAFRRGGDLESYIHRAGREGSLSAMECFLEEPFPAIALIGGPGFGKSTLGQYLAQVHRRTLLGDLENDSNSEFRPKVPRIPFRIVLKYLAQWIADGPPVDTIEAYLVTQITKLISRELSSEELHTILRARPCLVIFDGLDEVIEPDLRTKVLNRVSEFLMRTEQIGAELMILATSRPTGYKEEFRPDQFWHLDLQPMSEDRVWDYSKRWTFTKMQSDEEQKRVLDILKECLQEEHTRLLLSTPLQVTIVLLIIKDGGKPPTQREALFHEYWGTILRRERSKAKGVIRTDETVLFDLHAYLGYLLQRRVKVNVRSLLPASEFEAEVLRFLRSKDSHSADDVLRSKASQMAGEARERLVLLVEPEPGYFGFELRSLQEFFAAAFLAQTATDTTQRFERLRAIAHSAHWHNVGLFFAGRIVRTFGGEAVNILEFVCRTLDRSPPDRYLRRGAWLALDIGAEGVFSANRDLQYASLEYGVSALGEGLQGRDTHHFVQVVSRLSRVDRTEILEPLLCRAIENAISTSMPDRIRFGINLAVEMNLPANWIAHQLAQNWVVAMNGRNVTSLWESWLSDPQYVEQVLQSWSPPEEAAKELLQKLVQMARPSPILERERIPLRIGANPKSQADQVVLMFQCLGIISSIISIGPVRSRFEPMVRDVERGHLSRTKMLAKRSTLDTEIEELLSHHGLHPSLRAVIWTAYWATHEPKSENVSEFLEEIALWRKNGLSFNDLWTRCLAPTWPLLSIAAQRTSKFGHKGTKLLRPYLTASQEKQINTEFVGVVANVVSGRSLDYVVQLRLATHINDVLPGLSDLSKRLGVFPAELVDSTVVYWPRSRRLRVTTVQNYISAMDDLLKNKEYDSVASLSDEMFPTYFKFETDVKVQTEKVLSKCIKLLRKEKTTTLAPVTIGLFLALAETDPDIQNRAPSLFRALGSLPEYRWSLMKRDTWRTIPLSGTIISNLSALTHYVAIGDSKVSRGALKFWSLLVREMWKPGVFPQIYSVAYRRISSLRFDYSTLLPHLNSKDIDERSDTILILSLCDIPIAEEANRLALHEAMAEAQSDEEVSCWIQFIRQVPMRRIQFNAWKYFLESILSRNRSLPLAILDAARIRYSSIISREEPDIKGTDAHLGLPTVDINN